MWIAGEVSFVAKLLSESNQEILNHSCSAIPRWCTKSSVGCYVPTYCPLLDPPHLPPPPWTRLDLLCVHLPIPLRFIWKGWIGDQSFLEYEHALASEFDRSRYNVTLVSEAPSERSHRAKPLFWKDVKTSEKVKRWDINRKVSGLSTAWKHGAHARLSRD